MKYQVILLKKCTQQNNCTVIYTLLCCFFFFAGTILVTSIESVNDLTSLGIKVMHAKALFKLIHTWNSNGLPAAFVADLDSAGVIGSIAAHEPRMVRQQGFLITCFLEKVILFNFIQSN